MRIALYGIGGTYNYGCEAIVRGTERILHSAFPDAQIDLVTPSTADDRMRLAGVDVGIRPVVKYKNDTSKYMTAALYHLQRLLRKAKADLIFSPYAKVAYGFVKDYDLVLSIGGDIYTEPPADEPSARNPLLDFGEYAKRKNKPLIVWGASIGPFSAAESVYSEHFGRCAAAIAVREQKTYDYMKTLGYTRAEIFADPAFALAEPSLKPREKMIGFNLSPLSARHLGFDPKESAKAQAAAIDRVARELDCDVGLFPHVYSKFPADDDYAYLRGIKENLKCDARIIGGDAGFLGIRGELSRCCAVIGARMHFAVNAASIGVPPVFLSYSIKSKGMCEQIYGSDRYCLQLDALTGDTGALIERTAELIDFDRQQNEAFAARIGQLKKSAYAAAEIIEKVLR